MKENLHIVTLLLTVVAFTCSCRLNAPPPPTVDEATGRSLAFGLSFVFESNDHRAIGCATLLLAQPDVFYVALPVELANQDGCRLVEWLGNIDGQKYHRVEFSNYKVLCTQPSFKLAILQVSGVTSKKSIEFANTENREFLKNFDAYGSRVSHPRPIDAISLKVSGLIAARASSDVPTEKFFQVDNGLDFKTLGSPLVTKRGQLAAVAVGNLWSSTLYCPATNISKLLKDGQEIAQKNTSEVFRPISELPQPNGYNALQNGSTDVYPNRAWTAWYIWTSMARCLGAAW